MENVLATNDAFDELCGVGSDAGDDSNFDKIVDVHKFACEQVCIECADGKMYHAVDEFYPVHIDLVILEE